MKEYKIVEVKKRDAEKTMNAMAAQGWEVVSMTYWNYWKVCLMIVFFKRSIKDWNRMHTSSIVLQ